MQTTPQLQLKDIHLPDAVSWWPPATGYWLLLLLMTIIVLLVFFLRRLKSKQRLRKEALAELNRIKAQYKQDLDDKKLVTDIATLLRRAAISSYPRTDCASLTGPDWLNWLDSTFKSEQGFSKGPGHLLTEFNYSAATHSDEINSLIDLSSSWLKQLPTKDSQQKTPSKEPAS